MANLNTRIYDKIQLHSVDISRIEAGLQKEVRKFYQEMGKSLRADLAAIDPTGTASRTVRVNRLKKLEKASFATISKSVRRAKTMAHAELRELANFEALWTKDMMNRLIGVDLVSIVPSNEMVRLLVSDTLIQGAPSAKWWGRQASSLKNKFMDEMREGVFRGEGLGKLVRRIRGRRELGFADGLMFTSTRNAEALARTSVQAITNEARNMVYNNNLDVISGLQWIATFDGRTTQICMSLDGNEWTLPDYSPVGNGPDYPGPTAHWNCRSTQVPVTRSWEELGATKKVKEISPSTRSSMDGQVASTLNYEAWLKTKPVSFQKKVLGPTKHRLWSEGKLTFRDLIDETARPLRVSELRGIAPAPAPVRAPAPVISVPQYTEAELDPTRWEVITEAIDGNRAMRIKFGVEKIYAYDMTESQIVARINAMGEELSRLHRDFPEFARRWNVIKDSENTIPHSPRKGIKTVHLYPEDDLRKMSGDFMNADGIMKYHEGELGVAGPDAKLLKVNAAEYMSNGRYASENWVVSRGGWHGTFRHEVAHAYQVRVMASGEDYAWRKLYNHVGKGEYFKKHVSEYAGKTYREAFAESFNLYTSPNYRAGTLPELIEEYMNIVMLGEF